MKVIEQPIKHVSPFFKEFKEFATRGNVIDLAVGVIIGAAFGKVVSSLVTNVVMPPLAALTGQINFADRFVALSEKHYDTIETAKAAHVPVITYGVLLDDALNFLLVAFSVFVMIRVINKLYPKPADPPAKKDCPYCISSIPILATRCPNCTSQLETAK